MTSASSNVANDPRRDLPLVLRTHSEALLMVAAATLIGLLIAPRWGNSPVVLLYVPPVLAAAVMRGLGPSVLAAVASTLAYNFFFTAPYGTFQIYSPADLVTVIALFIVALVTSRLAGSMREQARIANAHAVRNATIAGLARRLLSCANESDIAQVAVSELSRLFDCNAILVEGTDHLRQVASMPVDVALNPGDHAAAILTLGTGKAAGRGVEQANLADWQFHAVLSDQAVLAAVGLARNDGLSPVSQEQLALLENLLDQVALALVRGQLEREARAFAALRERDRIRAALLASIGQDVKPRITAIMAAARALRRGASSDKALVSSVASEASKLHRYVDNLLDISPDSDRKPIEGGGLAIDLYQRSVSKDGLAVRLTPKEYAVLAELAKHAGRVLTHSHLLRTVWGPAHERQIEYLRVAIGNLRQKLESNPAEPALIINEPAVGYRLKLDEPFEALQGLGP